MYVLYQITDLERFPVGFRFNLDLRLYINDNLISPISRFITTVFIFSKTYRKILE